MIYIITMLYGRETAKRYFWAILTITLFGAFIGICFFLLPFFADPYEFIILLCIPILLEAIRSFFCAAYCTGAARGLRISRGLVLLFMVYVVLFSKIHAWETVLSGFITGLYLMVSSVWKMSNSVVLKFKRWKLMFAVSVLEFMIGLWNFIPWSFDYSSRQIYWDVGTLILIYSLDSFFVYYFVTSSQLADIDSLKSNENEANEENETNNKNREKAVLHVWTTTGQLPLFFKLIQRYIVSRNSLGVISTGHVAFELDEVYISHYPEKDIERDTSQFLKILKSTEENNDSGVFQISYNDEMKIAPPSNFTIPIDGVSKEKLDEFWNEYRKDTTYNLTNRNCSTVVSLALIKSTEGYFTEKRGGFMLLLKLLFSPELWVMSQLRKHASIMTWTPGIVLDYSRAMSVLLKM
ncbi:peptidase [Providencia rustigianii]|uniref:peptidase n=1 Tax=Providencia rustigianii TaxID=158850 RepID=UPI0012B6565B|nr:peptidase [Providencia rustigianii]MTC59011.1 peptidase [Providencia rustigianii]